MEADALTGEVAWVLAEGTLHLGGPAGAGSRGEATENGLIRRLQRQFGLSGYRPGQEAAILTINYFAQLQAEWRKLTLDADCARSEDGGVKIHLWTWEKST